MNAAPNLPIPTELPAAGPQPGALREGPLEGAGDGASPGFMSTLRRVEENKLTQALSANRSTTPQKEAAGETCTDHVSEECTALEMAPAALEMEVPFDVLRGTSPVGGGLEAQAATPAIPLTPAPTVKAILAEVQYPDGSPGERPRLALTLTNEAGTKRVAETSTQAVPSEVVVLQKPDRSLTLTNEAGTKQVEGTSTQAVPSEVVVLQKPDHSLTAGPNPPPQAGKAVKTAGPNGFQDFPTTPPGEPQTDSTVSANPERPGEDEAHRPWTNTRPATTIAVHSPRPSKGKTGVRPPGGAEKAQPDTVKTADHAEPPATPLTDGEATDERSLRALPAENPVAANRAVRSSRIDTDPRADWLVPVDRNGHNINAAVNRTATPFVVEKELPSPAESFRENNVSQIVERIAVSVRGNQSEARIALKPDHLGSIRLQIATENNTVSIRIMTEFSMARDLLESHLHQLKTELQQQGLEVEEFSVKLSEEEQHFRREERRPQRNAQARKTSGNPADSETRANEKTEASRRVVQSPKSSGVDYFA